MSEQQFFERMNEGTAARVAAQREQEEAREANLRKKEEAREALAAEAEVMNRTTRKANRRRRAMLRTWRRLTVWLALVALLVMGYTEGMVEPGLALAVGLLATGLVGLEEVGA